MTSITLEKIKPAQARDEIRLTFPNGVILSGPIGTKLADFVTAWQANNKHSDHLITAVLLDNSLRELSHIPTRDSQVEPLDLTTVDGMRIYKRSLFLVMLAAIDELFPGTEVHLDHSITANGFFCRFINRPPLTEPEVRVLEDEMRHLIETDLPITRPSMPVSEARDLFAKQGAEDKLRLLRFYNKKVIKLCQLGDYIAGLYGRVVPSTGYLKYFNLWQREDGIVLLFPLANNPETMPERKEFPKVREQFRQAHQWLMRIGAEDAGSLNEAISAQTFRGLVMVAEALHERRIAEIANYIAERSATRIVLIAGPSSSGKTTFAKRLGVQLAACGLRSFAIGLDDFFVDRELTPKDEKGEYDFEAFDAVDHRLFEQYMLRLLDGEKVILPRYDFLSGKRTPGNEVRLSEDTVLLVEGIHGLNPELLQSAPRQSFVKVFVSCLSQLNIDHQNYIPTSDARLMRRIVRDAMHRGYSAEETIIRWQSVRRGEGRYIFPYQEDADLMFNSALPYEMAVLKPLAEPLLLRIFSQSPAVVEARRLLALLSWFIPAETSAVPDNSILREFIGGSIMEKISLPHTGRF